MIESVNGNVRTDMDQGSACKIFGKLQILHFTRNLETDFTFYILQEPVKNQILHFTNYKGL